MTNWSLWWGDVRYAARNAARRPGFTLLVALTLALGLGVNSAVFALIDAALLRPLPYRDPSRLVFAWQTLTHGEVYEIEATPFVYDVWRRTSSLSEVGMITYASFALTGGDAEPERVRGARITASTLPMLGLTPALGRVFTAAEDDDGAPAVAILSDGLWRRRYGADAGVLGRVVQIDGEPRVIVGVMPAGAALPGPLSGDDRLWLSMSMTRAERANEQVHHYTVVARLADGRTLAGASDEMHALTARLVDHPALGELGVRLVPLAEQTARTIRPALLVSAASVALLLIIASANASTLLIARTANRGREFALRTALGATRGRLLSLSIAESLIFASIGGLAALVLGQWTLRGLIPLFAASLPQSLSVGIDARAALFTAGLALAIGVVFGALAAHRPAGQPSEALGGSGRSTPSPGASARRDGLVIGQVALAVVLLSAAGLMLSSVVKLSRVKPGFDPDHLLTFNVGLAGARYAAAEPRVDFVSRLLDRVQAAPGVRTAAVTSVVPFDGRRSANTVEIEGHAPAPGEPSMIIDQRYVSPGYFQTLRIPMLRGRPLAADDTIGSDPVTVINRTMAQRYFADASPINRRVRTAAGFDSGIWFRIVGVVDDVHHLSLDRDPVPEMYRPIAQTATPLFTVVVRTIGDPAAMTPTLRAVLQSADADVPLSDVRTMDDRIGASLAQTRATMILLIVTAALAAALAAVAIYGSIWYSVVQRTPEIGIRVALGATRASLFGDVVGSAVRLSAIGAVIGSAGAIASGRLLQTLLFDTRASDPWTHASVALGVVALSVVASLAPAIRAMRVDPLVALRAS